MPVHPTPPTFPRGGFDWFQYFREMLRHGWLSPYGISRFIAPLQNPFEGPGFDFGFPFERLLPPDRQTEKIQLLTAALDRPLVLAYGVHLVGGNVILQYDLSDDEVLLFIALGEGEWDRLALLWVNGLAVDVADTNRIHFHPGLEGELGVETSPGTRNQKICSFLPSGFSPALTFSRTAYVALKLRRDPLQPGPDYHILGIYNTLRVRDFNASGITGYDWSFNPARVALDLLLRGFLFPHGKTNETLPSSVTDRIDFSAWNDWKTFCDADLTINGRTVNRFEAHIALVDQSDLLRALEWVLLQGRAYLLERNGKFAPFADNTRSSQLSVGFDHIAPSSLQLSRRSLRDSANLFRFRFRSTVSGAGAGTITSSGTTVTGVGTVFTQFFKPGHQLQLDEGPQAGEMRTVDEITSDTALKINTAFSADQGSARRYANPAHHFMPQLKELADEEHQDFAGRIIPVEVDLGNSTPERAERLAEHLKRRTLDLDRQLRCRLLPDLTGVNDLLPGDIFTAPSELIAAGGATREWEILEISDETDGAREIFALEYDPAVFVDTANVQQIISSASLPTRGILGNAPQMRNVLQNGSFFRAGVSGQEGTNRPKYFNGYSNSGGSPAWTTDLEHVVADDRVKIKTKTSTVDKIGLRSIWKDHGRLFKPGQKVTVAISIRHNGTAGRYNKDIKVKLDSNAEDYNQPDGTDYAFTIPSGSLPNHFVVRYAFFTFRGDASVPDTLNLFLWSEATNASKSNEDLEVDWVVLSSGVVPVAVEPMDEIADADITWDAGTSRYSLPTYLRKDTAASSDSGGAGGTSGGGTGGGDEGDSIPPIP